MIDEKIKFRMSFIDFVMRETYKSNDGEYYALSPRHRFIHDSGFEIEHSLFYYSLSDGGEVYGTEGYLVSDLMGLKAHLLSLLTQQVSNNQPQETRRL